MREGTAVVMRHDAPSVELYVGTELTLGNPSGPLRDELRSPLLEPEALDGRSDRELLPTTARRLRGRPRRRLQVRPRFYRLTRMPEW